MYCVIPISLVLNDHGFWNRMQHEECSGAKSEERCVPMQGEMIV